MWSYSFILINFVLCNLLSFHTYTKQYCWCRKLFTPFHSLFLSCCRICLHIWYRTHRTCRKQPIREHSLHIQQNVYCFSPFSLIGVYCSTLTHANILYSANLNQPNVNRETYINAFYSTSYEYNTHYKKNPPSVWNTFQMY